MIKGIGILLVITLSIVGLSGCTGEKDNEVKEFKKVEKEYTKLDMDKVKEYVPKIKEGYIDYVTTKGNRYGAFKDDEGNERKILLGKLEVKEGDILGEGGLTFFEGDPVNTGVYIELVNVIVDDISFVAKEKDEYRYIVYGHLYTTGAGSFNEKESRTLQVTYHEKDDKVTVEEMHSKYKEKSRGE